jgi:hypothetical protein
VRYKVLTSVLRKTEGYIVRRQNVCQLTVVPVSVQSVQVNVLRSLIPSLANFNPQVGHTIYKDSPKGCTKLLNLVKHE